MPTNATISLLGHAGSDGDLRLYGDGTKGIGELTICTSDYDKKTQKSVPTWWNVKAFGVLAEKFQEVRKGDLIFITGTVKTRGYVTKDGVSKTSLDVTANSFCSVTKKSESVRSTIPIGPGDDIEEDVPF